MKDFNAEISEFPLEDVADPYMATNNLLDKLGETWPELRSSAGRPAVVEIVESLDNGNGQR